MFVIKSCKKVEFVEKKLYRSEIKICCRVQMDVSKYTWMRDGCILVVEISSFKDGVFKTFLKSDEYAKEPFK